MNKAPQISCKKYKSKKKIICKLHKELTPSANVENGEFLNVISPAGFWSEKISDQNTKYKDITEMKTAWMVEIPLQERSYSKSQHSIKTKYKWKKSTKSQRFTGYSTQFFES